MYKIKNLKIWRACCCSGVKLENTEHRIFSRFKNYLTRCLSVLNLNKFYCFEWTVRRYRRLEWLTAVHTQYNGFQRVHLKVTITNRVSVSGFEKIIDFRTCFRCRRRFNAVLQRQLGSQLMNRQGLNAVIDSLSNRHS